MSAREAGAGKFSERIALLQPIISRDALGGQACNFVQIASIWAMLESTSAGMAVAENQRQEKTGYRFAIRRRADIKAGWKAIWRGLEYEVRALSEREETGLLTLLIEEGASL